MDKVSKSFLFSCLLKPLTGERGSSCAAYNFRHDLFLPVLYSLMHILRWALCIKNKLVTERK